VALKMDWTSLRISIKQVSGGASSAGEGTDRVDRASCRTRRVRSA
jgi:hypothetical protein